MDLIKKQKIVDIIKEEVSHFINTSLLPHLNEVNNPNGTINSKRKSWIMSSLSDEFLFYSAFVRSFDSSLGHTVENIGRRIAELSYISNTSIDSYFTTEQNRQCSEILDKYENHYMTPQVSHYENLSFSQPASVFNTKHKCDNLFYDNEINTYYIIELKNGGDLDNKKAKSEKMSLLKQYFMLKNIVPSGTNIKLYFATAYNKDGEGNIWNQANVKKFFADDELLIGKKYWDFVCKESNGKGYKLVSQTFQNEANNIIQTINNIKSVYLSNNN